MKTPLERFMEKVTLGPHGASEADCCWVWTGGTNGRGYGQFSLNGKRMGAHWFLLPVWPKPGQQACHHCDNALCVRPSHIFIGTQTDNMQDCLRKGRHKSIGIDKANSFRNIWNKGESNHANKLTLKQALRAKACPRTKGAATRMAKEFGVCVGVITGIRKGTRWAHLSAPAHCAAFLKVKGKI